MSNGEDVRDWVFTFGDGQRCYSIGRYDREQDRPLDRNGVKPEGFRLDDRYVVIRGTPAAARAKMVRWFGKCWSGEYESREAAGVDRWGLVELVVTDDQRWEGDDE